MKQKEQEYAKHSENKIINEKNTRKLSDEISKLEQNFRDVKLKWSQRNCYLAEIEDKNMEVIEGPSHDIRRNGGQNDNWGWCYGCDGKYKTLLYQIVIESISY